MHVNQPGRISCLRLNVSSSLVSHGHRTDSPGWLVRTTQPRLHFAQKQNIHLEVRQLQCYREEKKKTGSSFQWSLTLDSTVWPGTHFFASHWVINLERWFHFSGSIQISLPRVKLCWPWTNTAPSYGSGNGTHRKRESLIRGRQIQNGHSSKKVRYVPMQHVLLTGRLLGGSITCTRRLKKNKSIYARNPGLRIDVEREKEQWSRKLHLR